MLEKQYSPEEVLKILRTCSSGATCIGCPMTQYDCANSTHSQLAAPIIADLLAQLKAQRWIPVTERLPVVGEDALTMSGIPCVEVLVVIEGCTTATTLYCDGEDFFDVQGDEIIPYRVMCWRPMPEVPGEEGA